MFNPLDFPVSLLLPDRLCLSAWHEHFPFSLHLLDVLRPRTFVELGTHCGFSYCGFCQGVQALHLSTSCYAVDTWEGDPHSGTYDGSVYAELEAYHNARYADFSQLLRRTFDAALDQFPDGTVDLLHIDGFHTYEAVKHDFETWLPKVSEGGVVLFHDTNVHDRNFGIYRFWAELKESYPTFEFVHGHGLGVLFKGKTVPSSLEHLFDANPEETARIRLYFHRLGSLQHTRYLLQEQRQLNAQLEAASHRKDDELESSRQLLEHQQQELDRHIRLVRETQHELALAQRTGEQRRLELVESRLQLAELESRTSQLSTRRADEYEAQIRELTKRLDEATRVEARLATQVSHRDAQFALVEHSATSLQQQLDEIHASMTFRAAHAARRAVLRVAPRGSLRHRGLTLGFKALRVWKREGTRAALGRVRRRLPGQAAPAAAAPHALSAENSSAHIHAWVEPPPYEGTLDLPAHADPYDVWLRNNEWNEASLREAERELQHLERQPLLSVVMPVYDVDAVWLERAIESVQEQVYPNWELCIADDASPRPHVRRILRRFASQDPRIKIRYLSENGHISRATNMAAELASGDYLVFLDHDDELTPDCLLEIAKAVNSNDEPDIVYSDDDKIDTEGHRYHPQFKPAWSPELLLSYMYMCHVFCVRRDRYEQVGGLRPGFEGCQDYDLALRLTDGPARVVHVPKVLYHWRSLPASTAATGAAKPEAFERGRRAVQEALDRRKIHGTASRPEFAIANNQGLYEIDFPEDGPEVAILIPTLNRREMLEPCIQSILQKTRYRNFRIYVLEHATTAPEMLEYLAELEKNPCCKVLHIPDGPEGFSFSALNNEAVEQIGEGADYILFLNDDTAVYRPEWLSQLVGYAGIEGVGAVGARLLYPDGRVQHAGVLTDVLDGLPSHAFKLASWSDHGYMSFASAVHNYSAVTAACLLMKRDVFREIGGFDETRFAVAYNDVDLCLRLVERGLRCVYAPRAELLHFEGATRGFADNLAEPVAYLKAWGDRPDPFYNPKLARGEERYAIDTARETPKCRTGDRPVRALLCSHNLNFEGAPLILHEIAVGLKERGRVLPEIVTVEDGPLARLYREHEIPVHLVEHPLREASGNPAGYQRGVREFADWIQSQNYEVLHANTLVTSFAIDAARHAGLPSIWSIHESVRYREFFERFATGLTPFGVSAFAHPYRVVFASRATRALFEDLSGQHNFATMVTPLKRDGIERCRARLSRDEAVRRIGAPPDRAVVTIVGTVAERKGQRDFVRAALGLLAEGRTDAVYYVVGGRPGPYLDEIQQLIRGREEFIRIVPETEDVGTYFRASDVAVCCSYNECYPRVVLEAMHYGVPLVTTTVFGIAEQVFPDRSALVFQPGDHDRLGQHIRHLLDSPAERRRLIEGARLALEILPKFEDMIATYERYYLEAAATAADPVSHGRSLRQTGRVA